MKHMGVSIFVMGVSLLVFLMIGVDILVSSNNKRDAAAGDPQFAAIFNRNGTPYLLVHADGKHISTTVEPKVQRSGLGWLIIIDPTAATSDTKVQAVATLQMGSRTEDWKDNMASGPGAYLKYHTGLNNMPVGSNAIPTKVTNAAAFDGPAMHDMLLER